MQNYGKWLGAGTIVIASLTGTVGCADRNNNGQPDSTLTPGETAQAASNMANSVENAGDKMASAADNAVDATANAVDSAGDKMAQAGDKMAQAGENAMAATSNTVSGATKAVGGALNTGKIKSAIVANPSLNNPKNKIDVTTKGNQVMLNGMVQNETQKKLASSIAQQNAGGAYKVMNNLKVAGGASNKMSGQ